MRRVQLLFILIALFFGGVAQAQTSNAKFNWAIHTTGSANEYIQSIQTDNAGNVYAAGYFSGTVDFDPGPSLYLLTAQGLNDAFISKVAPNGSLLWVRQLSGPGDDIAFSCALDNTNNHVFVAGYFSDSIDLDPSIGINKQYSKGSTDLYVIALDMNANYLNALHLGGVNDDAVNAISIDYTGKVLATGYFQQSMVYGGAFPNLKTLSSAGGDDVFVLKWNPANTACDWALSIGSNGQQDGSAVVSDSKNNIRLAGYFENNVDFDPGASVHQLSNQGNTDLFVLGLDSNGVFQWAQAYGGTLFENALGLDISQSDEVLVGGFFQGNVNFGSQLVNSLGNDDACLLNFSPSGSLNWFKTYGGTGQDVINGLHVDNNNYILLTGYFQDTVLFDNALPSSKRVSKGSRDIFAMQADSNAVMQWVKSFGGVSDDWGNTICNDASGNYFVGGFFEQLVDFNPGAGVYNLMALNDDAFLERLSPCTPSYSSSSHTACATYTWHSISYTQSGTYYYFGTNFTGCDSLETLQLTILPTSIKNIFVQNCASQGVLFNGIMHHSSGVFRDTLVNYHGCDSFVLLHYTALQSSTNSFSVAICANQYYTFNGNNLNLAGTYRDTLVNYVGCDSFLILHLAVNALPLAHAQHFDECAGHSIQVGLHTYAQTGTYLDTLVAYLGCDSIVLTQLVIHPILSTTLNAHVCAGNNYNFNGSWLTAAGVYTDTLKGFWGCDSILTLNLKLDSSMQLIIMQTVCHDNAFLSHSDTMRNMFGCDSVITYYYPNVLPALDTTVVINNSYAIATPQFYCTYTWINASTGAIIGQGDTLFLNATIAYYLLITDTIHLCTDSSSIHTHTFNGSIEFANNALYVKEYPNPFNNDFYLSKLPVDGTYKIVNVLGQSVLQGKITSTQMRIDAEALQDGVYWIHISNNKGAMVYKSELIKMN